MSETAYARLEGRFRRMALVAEAEAVLQWDWSVGMPAGAAEARADQMAELKSIRHGLMCEAAVADWLAAAEVEELSPGQRANLREMRRRWRHQTALPGDLVSALSKAASRCESAWRVARPAGDFAAVLPKLEALLALVREEAAAKAAALGLSPYDALLDGFEPDGRSAEIDRVFADLEAFLPEFLQRVLEAQARRPLPATPRGPFPTAAQKELARRFMAVLGFEFEHGRLDESLHPFCGGTADDVRITTRYREDEFLSGLMGVLHETGHALYERGLPSAWRRQPAGDARGMSLHESQSLLFEMQACRSRPFIAYAAEALRDAFGPDAAWEPENLYRLYTRVAPGFIRVDADEVSYPLHVILRYRLETALIAGDLALRELPGAWNEGMRRLLGIVPASDREGCLQDIHWYDGAWGYFPTYTLGAMTAAQLFRAAVAARPEIPQAIGRGDFAPLLGWLRETVHAKGSLDSTAGILGAATGSGLSADPFKEHLAARYLA